MLARVAIPAAVLCTTHAFQPPKRRLPRIGQRRLVAPEEASVAVQAYAAKLARQRTNGPKAREMRYILRQQVPDESQARTAAHSAWTDMNAFGFLNAIMKVQ